MAVSPPMTPTMLVGYSSPGGEIQIANSGQLGTVVANMWCNLTLLEMEVDKQTPFAGEPAQFAYAKSVFAGSASRGGGSTDTLKIRTAYPWDGPAGNRIAVRAVATGTGAGELYYYDNILPGWVHDVIQDREITEGTVELTGLSMVVNDLEAPAFTVTQAADVRNGDVSGTTPLNFVAEAAVDYVDMPWYSPPRTNQPYDVDFPYPYTPETLYDYPYGASVGGASIAFADWDVSGVPFTDVYPNASPAIIVNTSGYMRFKIT